LYPGVGLKKDECVWDHKLVVLANVFAARNANFDLDARFVAPTVVVKMPMTIMKAFEMFDPFFSELRYPVEANLVDELGEEHGFVLDAVVEYLESFLKKIH